MLRSNTETRRHGEQTEITSQEDERAGANLRAPEFRRRTFSAANSHGASLCSSDALFCVNSAHLPGVCRHSPPSRAPSTRMTTHYLDSIDGAVHVQMSEGDRKSVV